MKEDARGDSSAQPVGLRNDYAVREPKIAV